MTLTCSKALLVENSDSITFTEKSKCGVIEKKIQNIMTAINANEKIEA